MAGLGARIDTGFNDNFNDPLQVIIPFCAKQALEICYIQGRVTPYKSEGWLMSVTG